MTSSRCLHEERLPSDVFVSKHRLQHVFALDDSIALTGVYYKHEAVNFGKVVLPYAADLVSTSEVIQRYVMTLELKLDVVEADRRHDLEYRS